MTPTGKIISLNAFKNKESGLTSSNGPVKGERKIRKGLGNVFTSLIVLFLSFLFAYMMTPSNRNVEIPPLGSIAPVNIKAPEDMLVIDKESTSKNKIIARNGVLNVYDFDSEAVEKANKRIALAFSFIESAYKTFSEQMYLDLIADMDRASVDGKKTPVSNDEMLAANWEKRYAVARKGITGFEKSDKFALLEKEFEEKLGVTLDQSAKKTARYYHFHPKIGKFVSNILGPIFGKGVVVKKDQLPPSTSKGLSLRFLSTGEERVVENLGGIYDIPEAYEEIKKSVGRLVPESSPGLKRLVTLIAKGMLEPNITFNRKETELRKDKEEGEVKPVFFQVLMGEMIIREGERITPIHHAKLNFIISHKKDQGWLGMFAGLSLLNLIILTIAMIFTKKFHSEIRQSPKMIFLLALLLVAHIGLISGFGSIFTYFITQAPGIDLRTFVMAAPLAFGPMIVSIFFTVELTVLFTVVAAMLTALLMRDFYVLPMLSIIGGMICAYQVRMYTKRSSILKVGLLIAIACAGVALAFGMVGGRFYAVNDLSSIPFAFVGGAMTAIFVSAAVPIIESVFPVVSDIKLLELTNLNHPLLRRMIVEAPGTYQHSMMVGNLAEEACKAIEANSLLARAGALFHDIGKMKKAEYFIENQRLGANPHDKLSPNMSVLILTNHIKEGIEIGKQYRLLPQIIKMIPEHHGTGLVRFFYEKAKDCEDIARAPVKETDFRYPGPIPSSKESACLAMADSIEAAARACDEPTPQNLREIVTSVINDKFTQGQLDESHLTLHELALIADNFTHVLTAIHHHRIRYPDAKEKERRQENGNQNPRPQKSGEAETV
ncbi:Membrane protein containing HD superfamily hydrolase domain, YQFF ortholog [hydrothermal vent metagenome]|uniref:Membrane protein containing HD superfamily hydrolase domain, YQFF ortholog n=1 Tax=hydrothermal vent metagenome TaxID=652676 RepID=A0A3B1BVM4_9ZZZZ